ncbi:MAG TPA: TM2 domain-containing protein [Gemmatimonadales bacterium]|nr:TM2 domain-containing protein [Gemmatimonadales bacterium]
MSYPVTDPESDYHVSPRSRGVALALGLVLGTFGAHRFYTGRVASGLAQLVTLGGLGLWWLYDVIIIASGNFRDAEGRRLLNWDPVEMDDPYRTLPPAVATELAHLRDELDAMHERLDFAERLLGRLPAQGEEIRS